MIWEKLEERILVGSLEMQLPDGRTLRIGEGRPSAHWTIARWHSLLRIATNYEMHLGQTYMNGEWSAGPNGLGPLLEVLMRNFPEQIPKGPSKLLGAIGQTFLQMNRVRQSYCNVEAHYEIQPWLYGLFLDPDLHYSCAFFDAPGLSLEQAQARKCQRLLDKLCLQPGQKVLDIGCGWGGLARYLASHADVSVTGITISRQQRDEAQRRAEAQGLGDRVEYRLADYREIEGAYDRIVSVGMFEHVGRPNYRRFFEQVAKLLKSDGVAVLHTIGRMGPKGFTNPWIQRHIFPGGYIPALSEVASAMESVPLFTNDVEVLREHYALTLDHWIARFAAHRGEICERLGERFFRTWEFYLASCAAAFRWRDLVVFQIQFAKHLRNPVPVTRSYLRAARGDA